MEPLGSNRGAPQWSPGPHPWRRYFSRLVDFALLGMLPYAGVIAALGAAYGMNSRPVALALSSWLGGPLLLVLSIPLEALLLCSWGFTPSRAICGIHIRRPDGGKPGFLQALRRSGLVALRGMGLGLPLLSLIAMFIGYRHLRANRAASWDQALGLEVRHRHWGPLRKLGVVAWHTLMYLVLGALLNYCDKIN